MRSRRVPRTTGGSGSRQQVAGKVKNLLLPVKAIITDIRAETADVRTYSLKLKKGKFTSSAEPGQFNMVGYPGVGEAPISLSSVVKTSGFQHTIRTVGRVTGFLRKLGTGDEIFLRGPYGSGWPLNNARDIVLIAGGLGLAPIRPVIQTILNKRDSFGNVTLIYGARDPLNMLFRDELRQWQDRLPVFLTVDEVPVGTTWEHNTGFVTGLMDRVKIDIEKTTAFICGPEIMMRFVARRLMFEGIAPSRLYVSLERRMKCGVAQCGHCQHGSTFVCKDGPVFPYRDASRFPDRLL